MAGEKMFTNFQVLRNKFNTVEDFADGLKKMTKDKDAIFVSPGKRRESRAGNKFWEHKIDSEDIRLQNNVIWVSDKHYLSLNDLDQWYIRIK